MSNKPFSVLHFYPSPLLCCFDCLENIFRLVTDLHTEFTFDSLLSYLIQEDWFPLGVTERPGCFTFHLMIVHLLTAKYSSYPATSIDGTLNGRAAIMSGLHTIVITLRQRSLFKFSASRYFTKNLINCFCHKVSFVFT